MWGEWKDRGKPVFVIDEIQQTVNYVECKCTDNNENGVYIANVSSGNQCVSQCTSTGHQPQITYYYDYVQVEHPSDGIVRVSSQTGFPGAVVGEKMNDSDHFQMRNNSETKDALDELLAGDYGSFFITDTK